MELGVGEEKPGYRAVAAAALQLLEDLGLRGNLVAHLDPSPTPSPTCTPPTVR